MDYTDGGPLDNSRYVPTLVPGMLQPLEELSDHDSDDFLLTVNIEALVKEVEKTSGGLPDAPKAPSEKDLKCFAQPVMTEKMCDMTNKSFSAATKKKALWAAQIFDQWKCIHNYKLKVDSSLSYTEIRKALINTELDKMCETLFVCHRDMEAKW